jgi:DNA polymerase-3 subunit epsilon
MLPPNLDQSQIDTLPDTPGVYRFYDERGALLYVGKSVSIRRRVLSHFSQSGDHGRDRRLYRSITHIDYDRCASDFSAQLLESQQIKERAPIFNRQLRKRRTLWHLGQTRNSGGYLAVKAVPVTTDDPETDALGSGLFRSKKQAERYLATQASKYQLCPQLCGLEAWREGPCFSYQLRRCLGACCANEPVDHYNARLSEALSELLMQAWPWDGAVIVVEQPGTPQEQRHLVNQWRWLGFIDAAPDPGTHPCAVPPAFDLDMYRILLRFIGSPSRQKRHNLMIEML